MNKIILSLFAATLLLSACKTAPNGQSSAKENVENEANKPDLKGDSALNEIAKFYASKLNATDVMNRIAKSDSIVKNDMSDIQDSCQFAFYPFGGPDFLYIHHIYPNADTYFMMGLEKVGTMPTAADEVKAQAIYTALRDNFNFSYYITKNMNNQLANVQVDGTLPLITTLMALDSCQIISVAKKKFDEKGNMVDCNDASANIAEIKFFSNKTPKHEQTFYYYSGDTRDPYFEAGLEAYFTKLKNQKVATFLKAASYLMHQDNFMKIRNTIIDNSFAVLQDDSGVPLRAFGNNWDFTLYGVYDHPIAVFTEACYQQDLKDLYAKTGANVRPLNIHIGYNHVSNWMCARKKK